MKNKKLKFILPVLPLTGLIPVAGLVSTACSGTQEDQGPEATKVTITLDDQELKDQTEFDIKETKKLQLKAKVEPAEANQDVTFQVVSQEGTGNIACSQTGIIYTNGCVGTITIKAISKTKNKLASDNIELVFWDSERLNFYISTSEETSLAYCVCDSKWSKTIEEVVVPSKVKINNVEYPVGGVGYVAFNDCTKLWYAHLPKNQPNFKYICAYSFYQCTALRKIEIPDSVIAIDSGSFSNCTALESVTLGKNITTILNSSFLNCTKLADLVLPASLTYIGAQAFRQCSSLKQINIPAQVQTIGESAFANCWSSHIYVDPESKYFLADEGALYNKSKTRLLQGQFDYAPTNGEGLTFYVDKNIQKIDARAFEYCENLTRIVFPDDSECTSIGEHCFTLCTSLTNCILPPKITEIKSDTFSYCWELFEIAIPKSVNIIQKYAFYGCDSLSSVEFEGEGDEAITWNVSSLSAEPAFNNDINVHWYEQLQKEEPKYTFEVQKMLNAGYLRGVGYYKDPEHPTKDSWTGGYSNCLWVKNDIPISAIQPTGTTITYNSDNPKVVNLGSTKITLKVDFAAVVAEADAKFQICLYNQDGHKITNEQKLWSDEIGTKEFTLTFDDTYFKKATSISAVISAITA